MRFGLTRRTSSGRATVRTKVFIITRGSGATGLKRISVALAAALIFALLMSSVAIVQLAAPPVGPGSKIAGLSSSTTSGNSAPQATVNANNSLAATGRGAAVSSTGVSPIQAFFGFFQGNSLTIAPGSWLLVGGLWIWRGRMKSRWMELGFDNDVFTLFVRMKGGKTRLKLLDALSLPKDRLQLAQELGLDWKGVDRHIEILNKYGFVREEVAYGKVRMYALTSSGKLLLQLLDELSSKDGGERVHAALPAAPEARERNSGAQS